MVPPPSLAFFNGTQRSASGVKEESENAKQNQSPTNDNDKDLLIQQLRDENADLRAKYVKLESEKKLLQERIDQHSSIVDIFYKQILALRLSVDGSKVESVQTKNNPTIDPELGINNVVTPKPF